MCPWHKNGKHNQTNVYWKVYDSGDQTSTANEPKNPSKDFFMHLWTKSKMSLIQKSIILDKKSYKIKGSGTDTVGSNNSYVYKGMLDPIIISYKLTIYVCITYLEYNNTYTYNRWIN